MTATKNIEFIQDRLRKITATMKFCEDLARSRPQDRMELANTRLKGNYAKEQALKLVYEAKDAVKSLEKSLLRK